MELQIGNAALRLIVLLLACSAAGCVYAPPYTVVDGGSAPAYGYSAYPGYATYGYPYARPAYAYPPVTLDFGFSYYDRGSRHHGRHGWGHHHGGRHHHGGHVGRSHHGGHGHHYRGGHGRGHGHGHGGRRR